MRSRLHLLLVVFAILLPASVEHLSFSSQPQSHTHLNFWKASQPLDQNKLDKPLLREAIIYYTNQIRRERNVGSCRSDRKMQQAAQSHSEELARRGLLSHESYIKGNAHLIDRLQNAGLDLGNTISGENLGADYFMAIAGIPYYIRKKSGKTVYVNAETKSEIQSHTYRTFAKRMVNNWLESAYHRKNLLNKSFERIGIGVAPGLFNGLPALYITQNFLGPLE